MAIRYKTLLVLLLTGVAVYLGVANVSDRVIWQQVSDGVEWAESRQGLEVRSLVTEGEGPDLAPGDVLISVQGIPVGGIDDLTEIREFLAVSLPSGTPANYEVQKMGLGLVRVEVPLLRQQQLSSTDILLSLIAFTYLGIGLIIFLRNFEASGAFHFFVVCLLAFVVFLYRHSGRADTFDILIYWVNTTAFLLLPAAFVQFCLLFPERRDGWIARHNTKLAVYLPACFLILLHAWWFTGWMQGIGLPRNTAVSGILDRLHLGHFLTLFVLGSLVLVMARRRASSSLHRQRMKWITRGTVLGVAPMAVFYGIPFLLGWETSPLMQASSMSLVVIPLAFGYAISSYRLMDVDVIFKRGMAYLIASSALVGLYVAIVMAIGQALQNLVGGNSFILFAGGALLVAFLFAPLKNRIQEQIDRTFYRERYDYRQSFSEFVRTLTTETSVARLSEQICERMRQTLAVTSVAVFLRDEKGGSGFSPYRGVGLSRREGLEISDDALLELAVRTEALIAGPSESANQALSELMEMGIHYVSPLLVRDRLIGFLGLGRRQGQHFLSSEDLQLVNTLSGYAAIALDNALLYRSLESNAAQLADLKAYADSVIESITVGVAVISDEGRVTTWNPTMRGLTGLAPEDVVGRRSDGVFPAEIVAALRRFITGTGWTVPELAHIHKTAIPRKNGNDRLVNITLAPFVSSENLDSGTLLLFDDVTEKVQLEQQLLQAEKLSSIGLFAAGIAHEVNTPLTGISSYVQMLIQETDSEDPNLDVLKSIEKQSFRASTIINNLLNFARVSETEVQQVNLNSLMLETLSLLDHPLRNSGVDVALDLDPGLPSTLGSGGRLQQVFMNLFLNARDAMPDGGELVVRTRQKNSTLLIEISDTGKGISPENVKRIYDPFFTTKGIGRGTGLGLSVSYGIIQEHSGRISVDSRPGKGTTFTLAIPLKRVN